MSYIYGKMQASAKLDEKALKRKFGDLKTMASGNIRDHEGHMQIGDMWRQKSNQSGSKDYAYH